MTKEKHPLRRRWEFIIQVTTNPNDNNYQSYGGAHGIKNKFKSWEHFRDYIESTLGPKPFDKAKLIRINQRGHFAPGNMMWAESKTLGRRQRTAVFLTYKGQRHNLKEWSEIRGINYNTMLERYHKGWSIAEVLGYAPTPKRGLTYD